MKKFYRICNKTIAIEAPSFLSDDAFRPLFEIEECEPQINIVCIPCPRLSIPEGDFVPSGNFMRLRRDGNFYHLFPLGKNGGALACYREDDFSHVSVYITEKDYTVLMDSRYFYSTLALPQLLLLGGTLIIHASYILYAGKGILFSAPCGVGKSTQAGLWQQHSNSVTVNGDKAAISLREGEFFADSLPFCGTSGICKNISSPLGAVVLLSQGAENTLRPLKGLAALQAVAANAYVDSSDSSEKEKCFEILSCLVEKVPIFSLSCRADKGAVDTLKAGLMEAKVF